VSKKSYHHGNLRTALIEKGIEIINRQGLDTLTLRNLATACGVSHAALYSHFASKDALYSAIENHITEKFATILKESVKETGETPEGLFCIGCAYVLFFARNPEYFRFIFFRSTIVFGDDDEDKYEPYDFYRNFMIQMFNKINYPHELRLKTFNAHWAMIHGLTSIAIMDGLEEVHIWEERVSDMLRENYMLFPTKHIT